MTTEVIVITEVLNGVISGHHVFAIPRGEEDEESRQANAEAVKRAEDTFINCIKENMPYGEEDRDDYLDDGYAYDDNGYEISLRWEDIR